MPYSRTSSSTMKKTELSTTTTLVLQRTQESLTLWISSQGQRTLLLVAIPKTSSSSPVMLMVSYLQSRNWRRSKQCSTSSQATQPRWLVPKWESRNPRQLSQHALVRLSSLCIQLCTLKCSLRKFTSMTPRSGWSILAGVVVAMEWER